MKRNDKGQFTSPDSKTLSNNMEELLGLYLYSLKQQKPDTKQSTLDTRRREVRYWLAYCENHDIDPLAAETADVRGYIQQNTDLSDTTVGSYFRSIQSFYSITENDQAHDRLELENGHPCGNQEINLKEDYHIYESTAEYQKQHNLSHNDVDGVRESSSDILALKPTVISELFDGVPGKKRETRLRNEIAVRLNWYTACRSSELARMRIESIDWDDCSINVRSAKLNPEQHPTLIRRDVFFPVEFRTQLKRWCERVRHSFSSAVEPNTGRILVTTHSNEIEPRHINDILKDAARKTGIQRPLRPANPEPDDTVREWFVTTHRIRRSAISHWVNDLDEIDLHQARRMAGHANIEQTMEYVEPDDEALANDYQRAMSNSV